MKFSVGAGSARYHQRVAGANQSFLSSGRSRNLDFVAHHALDEKPPHIHRDQAAPIPHN